MAEAKTASTGPELTARSIIIGLIVVMIIGSAYPYCVLKLGFGPNLSVVSAFFGFMALVPLVFAPSEERTQPQMHTDYTDKKQNHVLSVRCETKQEAERKFYARLFCICANLCLSVADHGMAQ